MDTRLPQLSSAQRRCLAVVREHPDIAFAARRLHTSKGVLLVMLDELTQQLGDTAIQVEDDRVYLSRRLCLAIDVMRSAPDIGTNDSTDGGYGQ